MKSTAEAVAGWVQSIGRLDLACAPYFAHPYFANIFLMSLDSSKAVALHTKLLHVKE